MISSAVWIQYTKVTDRQTDRRTLDDSKDRAYTQRHRHNETTHYTATVSARSKSLNYFIGLCIDINGLSLESRGLGNFADPIFRRRSVIIELSHCVMCRGDESARREAVVFGGTAAGGKYNNADVQTDVDKIN